MTVVLVLAAGCTGDSEPGTTGSVGPSTIAAPTQPSPTPTPTAENHELVVTVRDEAPLSAYVVDGGTCTAPEADVPPTVVVSDGDGVELTSVAAPATARLTKSGACQSEPFPMTVPYAEAYAIAVGLDGDGVLDPAVEPPPTVVETSGSSQEVTVLR